MPRPHRDRAALRVGGRRIVRARAEDRDQHHPAEERTGEDERRDLGSDDVSDACERRREFQTKLAAQSSEGDGDGCGNPAENVGDELEEHGGAEADEDGLCLAGAFFAGAQDVRAGAAFGEEERLVLVFDERFAQGHHQENAEHAAGEGDQGELHEAGRRAEAFLRP